MRLVASMFAFVVSLLAVGAPAVGAPETKPQAPAAFLRDWVRGTARFDLFTALHEWAGPTHRDDSETFEVGVKVLALRRSAPAEPRADVARDLVRRFRAASSDNRTRLRALHVLGRLAAAEGLALLIEQSRSKDLALRVAAIRALGFYGHAPAREAFTVYGGRVRYVVQPPAANATATQALLAAVAAARSDRRRGRGAAARRAFRQRMSALAHAIEAALRAHRSPRVTEALLEFAEDPGALRVDTTALAVMLARCAQRDGVTPLVRAIPKGSTARRVLIAHALGNCARREAVKPLIALLGDAEASVVAAARRGLRSLSGEAKPPLTSDAASWARRLGPDGERFDQSRVEAVRDLQPGIYKLGA